MALCLAAGALAAMLPLTQFTLAWTHSIEKIRWEEDWRVDAGRLVLGEARILGTGAGMEPPEGARLVNGVWHYRARVAPLDELRLAHSPFTSDYEICTDAGCRRLSDLLPGQAKIGVVVLRACEAPAH